MNLVLFFNLLQTQTILQLLRSQATSQSQMTESATTKQMINISPPLGGHHHTVTTPTVTTPGTIIMKQKERYGLISFILWLPL